MKKSDAILMIAECLIEPHHEDVMLEAEYILNKMLRAGMLPPNQFPHDELKISYDSNGSITTSYFYKGKQVQIVLNKYEWELEDEQ